jgi:translocation and assembly module TamA
LLERLLRIYGYYQAEVVQSVSGIEPGQEVAATTAKVRFDIVPGPRFRFGAVELAGLDAAGGDFVLLRSNYDIQPGDPLHTDMIVDERDRLDTALAENGYPFAALGEPELTVDHARREGDLAQTVVTGGKYNYGVIVSDRPEFLSDRHLQQIARFKPGEFYRRSSAEDLRRAILATGIVANVTVIPRAVAPPTGSLPGTVDMEVKLVPGPLRTLAGAIGYDSGDGVRVEASWEHRNLFPPEGMLRLRGIAGTKEQLAGVTFRRNNFLGRDQVLTFDLYAGNVNRDAYAARSIGFTGSFEKVTTILFRKPLTWAAGFELLLSDEREALVPLAPPGRRTYTVGALPLRVAYDGSDDLLDPSRGFRAALRVSPEISFQRGQDSTYLRVQADASFYAPLGGTVLAARGRLGMIPGAPLTAIAPSRRFYAGGGGSVRGFGYQQIGPRDVLGDPSGGRSLAEFSLEARVPTGLFGGAVSVVPFIDGGTVDEASLPRFRDIRYGAGLGLRWATGFGPIRVDVGTPLNRRPGESRIAVYVALGQAF